jgi:hypothetical protein
MGRYSVELTEVFYEHLAHWKKAGNKAFQPLDITTTSNPLTLASTAGVLFLLGGDLLFFIARS